MRITIYTIDCDEHTIWVHANDTIGEAVRQLDREKHWLNFSVLLGSWELDLADTFENLGIEDGARLNVRFETLSINVVTDAKATNGDLIAGEYFFVQEEFKLVNARGKCGPQFAKGDMRVYCQDGLWRVTNTYTDITEGKCNLYSRTEGAALPFHLEWNKYDPETGRWRHDKHTSVSPVVPLTHIRVLTDIKATNGDALAGEYERLPDEYNGQPLFGKDNMRVYFSLSSTWWVTNDAADIYLDSPRSGFGNMYSPEYCGAASLFTPKWQVRNPNTGAWSLAPARCIIPAGKWDVLFLLQQVPRSHTTTL